MNKESKNLKIRESRLRTKEKRKNQECRVRELKIVQSHLNKNQFNSLNMFFIEARWIYNYVLSLQESGIDIFNINYKDHSKIKHFNKDRELVQEELKFLSSQMRQDLFQYPKNNLIKLAKLKKSNGKVGKLRYKSEINSIPLRQYGVTYKLIPEYNKVKIQGIKKSIAVKGLNQLKDCELANAYLIKKPSGFYIKVTTYRPKEQKPKTGKTIGLDFGIKTGITTSTGKKFTWNFQEPKRLKQIQKSLQRKKRGSSNYLKTKKVLNLCYEKLNNKKKDAINKFINKLTKENDFIFIQDESIKGWKESDKKGWGSRIHHSILGGIIAGLKEKPTTLVVNRWIRTTKDCLKCGTTNSIKLNDRTYCCSKCGLTMDRDVHSALRIQQEGLKLLPTDYREVKLVEKACLVEPSLKQENAMLNPTASKEDALL